MSDQNRRLEMTLAVIAIILGIIPMVIPNASALRLVGLVAALALLTAALLMMLKKPGQLDSSVMPTNFSFVPATPEDLVWIAGLEERQFHEDAVPLEILREWYSTNPNGFLVVHAADGIRVGHIDILPVREEPFRLFVEGTITERGIRGTSIFGAAQRADVHDLYVESVVVLGRDKDEHRAVVATILSNVDLIFGFVAETSNIRHIYGLAATKAGGQFMKRWGFEVITGADSREDGHPLYWTRYDALKRRISNRLS